VQYLQSILLIIGILCSSASIAQWSTIDINDQYSVFVDKTTIKRNGNIVQMWELKDFRSAQLGINEDSYLSSKIHSEYDCLESNKRILTFVHFTENMGKGRVLNKVIYIDKWSPIANDKIIEKQWKVACRK
jgi:hypothetical protein